MTRKEQTFEWLKKKFQFLQEVQNASGLVISERGWILGKIHIDDNGIWSEIAIACGWNMIYTPIHPITRTGCPLTKKYWRKILAAYRIVHAKDLKKVDLT